MNGRLRLGRRGVVKGLAACTLASNGWLSGCAVPMQAPPSGRYWVSAQGDDPETQGLVAVPAEGGGRAIHVHTPFRGHDVAAHPHRSHEVVLFGRRPGTQSAVIDLRSMAVVHTLEASTGYAFQGHGFFTPDGSLLVTTEAHTVSGAGRLGLWDTERWRLVGELDTHGIGPHEAQLMPNGSTVVVANGGLLTRPETGRQVLNLDSMDSTLTYLELGSGAVLEERRVDDSKSSIRHLDVAEDGTVALGVQVQREALDHGQIVPMAGTHRRGEDLHLFEQGREHMGLLNDYVGSVALSESARVAGFTSPRGNVAMFWHLDTGTFVGAHSLADVSGLATTADGSHFVLSSSLGEVRMLSATNLTEQTEVPPSPADVRWDNHLIEVTLDGTTS